MKTILHKLCRAAAVFSKKSLFPVIPVALAVISGAIICSCSAGGGKANNPKNPGEIAAAPYPYKAMLAICSDIDGSTLVEFEVYHQFLNTLEDTYLGKGLGLDIADSFWMFAVNDDGEIIDSNGNDNSQAMAYFKIGAEETKYSQQLIHYFNSGWIDSIHSYGDFSRVDTSNPVFTRNHALLANEEMTKNNMLPSVWINHGNAANVQNIRGPQGKRALNYQQGADPSSQYYHSDFTIPSGIKYIWFSDPGGKFAYDTPLYPVTLKDGQKVWGFRRYTGTNVFFAGHNYNWSIYGANEQLSQKNLDTLVNSNGAAVVAQHLGSSKGAYIFPGSAKEAFARLKQYEDNKDILVARTSRLLEFVRVRDNLNYTYTEEDGVEKINLLSVDDPVLGFAEATDPGVFKGISFYVKNAVSAEISIGGKLVPKDYVFRDSNADGLQVIGFNWYEKDTTNYLYSNR